MSGHVRVLPPGPDWRTAQADALEATIAAISGQLAPLGELEALFERDHDVAHATRVLAALLRSRRNDLAEEAAKLRAAVLGAAAEAAAEAAAGAAG